MHRPHPTNQQNRPEAARTTTNQISQTMDNTGRNSSSHLSNDAPPPPDESTEVRQNKLNDDELTAPHGHHDNGSSSSAGSIPPLARREDSSASEDDSSEAMQNHTIKVGGYNKFRHLPYYLLHCKTHGLKAVRNQVFKKKAAESICNEMKLKGDILLNTNNDEVVGLSRSG